MCHAAGNVGRSRYSSRFDARILRVSAVPSNLTGEVLSLQLVARMSESVEYNTHGELQVVGPVKSVQPSRRGLSACIV